MTDEGQAAIAVTTQHVTRAQVFTGRFGTGKGRTVMLHADIVADGIVTVDIVHDVVPTELAELLESAAWALRQPAYLEALGETSAT